MAYLYRGQALQIVEEQTEAWSSSHADAKGESRSKMDSSDAGPWSNFDEAASQKESIHSDYHIDLESVPTIEIELADDQSPAAAVDDDSLPLHG